MSPMSPTFSQQSGGAPGPGPVGGNMQPGSFTPYGPGGPPSPTIMHNSNFASSPPASAALLATPQLYWTQRRIMGTNPFPRFQHTSSTTISGTDIYLYGGSQRGTTKGDLFVIDSVSLQCQAIAAAGSDSPVAKSGHSAVNIGQYIIYFGGWDPMTGQCDDSLHVLHTARKEWNKPAIQGPLPTPRHSHTGCSVGTTMYIFGGQVDNYYLDDIVAFDMKTITTDPRWGKLEPQTESPPARAGHCAGVHDNKIYIFGGADADYFYNDIWCFDPRALTWTPIPASGYLPTGRHGHACTVADGVMYIFGGNSPDGTELNDAYAFKIHERRWYLFQNVGPVASARSGHTMCTIKDRIFILGGESEQTKLEDSAQIYYLEISKVRYPDATPQTIPPRQASSQRLGSARPGESPTAESPQSGPIDMDRNSGQQRPPERPERPDRPDRRHTQRPASPATFDRQGSSSSLTISQQTSQLMNPQLGQRPLTTFGAPPPRGASTGFQNTNATPDYQAEGLSVATRRQTLRDDFQGGYGGAVVGTASPVSSPIINRRTMHQVLSVPSNNAPSPSPLRVINVSPSSPPITPRSLPGDDENSPTTERPMDRRTMNSIPPPIAANSQREEINPYVMEAITPSSHAMSPTVQSSSTPSSGAYIPPPPPPGGNATSRTPPPITAVVSNHPAAPSQTSPSVMRANLPPPPTTSSPPVSGSIHLPPGADRRPGPTSVQPPTSSSSHPVQASTPIPGPLDRSSSPAPARSVRRSSGGSNAGFGLGIGSVPVAPAAGESNTRRVSVQDITKIKAAQNENELLKQEIQHRQQQMDQMRKRENWLMAEIILARDSLAEPNSGAAPPDSFQDKRLSMMDLEQELERGGLEGQQLKITKALIRVKEELKNAKMSIVTQAQAASTKIREAERIRTGALQEAAYLKAKLSSMSNAQQDPSALARVEMERAADLEKRLTSALNELESLEGQHAKTQETLEQEKAAHLAAEERSHGSTQLAEQAQSAHMRALSELASLHSRATKAETESREYATQLAETQAGFSGRQSQSSGLLQKIKDLKQQVEEHENALERTQKAYTAANERAMRAEVRSDEASQKIDKLESLRFELSTEANRYKGESERLQSKIEDLESRWQVSKDEVLTLRKLVEDGLGAFSPRIRSEKAPERKHDSIAILNTVSKVSELEHELGSLKRLHSLSQESVSKSSAELAEAMIEVSRLEQASMQARAETISLQRMLSQERENSSELKSQLGKTEQHLEVKIKELEDHEVQLGLLQDVMREKGIIAEDVVVQARARGTAEYAVSLEQKVREAEEHADMLGRELEEARLHFSQQLETVESQRQAATQRADKSGLLLRKIKNDLEATIQEKETVEAEMTQLQEEHAQCGDHAQELNASRNSQKEQEEERVEMLKMHWDEERRELTDQINDLQGRLMESEMHSAELSQKIISITERLQEVETLNETIVDELEGLQDQTEQIKAKAVKTEEQLKTDVERLVSEIHQVQEKLLAKQNELDDAFELNERLESQLDHTLQSQAAAVTAASTTAAATTQATQDAEAIEKLQKERQDLEQRLKKAREEIQILVGDNSVLEARLSDAEKKVALLLEDMQSSIMDVSSPNSPLISDTLAEAHQQLSHHPNPSQNMHHQQSTPATTAQRLINNARNRSSGQSGSQSNSPSHGAAKATTSAANSLATSNSNSNNSISSNHAYMQSYGQVLHADEFSDGEYDYNYGQGGADHQQQKSDSNRDSVDSITRELEMLKVPWNKSTPAFTKTDNNVTGSSSTPSSTSQQQQQQPQGQTYQYSGKLSEHQNQFYEYSDDSSDGDNEEEYLSHLKQQQQQQMQQQQQSMDTRSFNDRSPSRLKEYEQMIDEIENSRIR
ncbi:Negative regulator of mitotic exit [Mortierella claussenii]|nr:Negative regulator of mitotic exit [Mortierella claussenii]